MVGSVSGGCVESDVFARALEVLASRRPVLAEYGIADEVGIAVGLSCGGNIEVLIEPFEAGDAWRAVRDAVASERPAVLGIALSPEPLAGRKLAVLRDASCQGSIDAGLDASLAAELAGLLPGGGTRLLDVEWRGESARVFAQAFPAPLRLFIVGATHTAIALSRMAKAVGYRVHVIDARSPFATPERFSEADEVLRAQPGDVLESAGLDASSYLVTLSHDPKFDVPALACALRSQAPYIGALGSKATQERRRVQLLDEGFNERDLARIRGPIGLDIGARTPEEMAVAILAEMVATRHDRGGGALRERRAPIHDR